MGIRSLARTWLRLSVLTKEVCRPDRITVVIGVRNRTDYRLANALTSIRRQTLPANSIRIIVVDYGSEPTSARLTAEMCREYLAVYTRIEHAGKWSRARCLNVGLRKVDTKFLMTYDVDIILSPGYLSDAVETLRRSPLAIVCSPMLDLPEDLTDATRDAASGEGDLRIGEWRGLSTPRFGWGLHPSITVAYTAFYQLIRGYDEYYRVWGREDADLIRRLTYLGLRPKALESESFYLHQWHPKFEGVLEEDSASHLHLNRVHFKSNHSILRNGEDWGNKAESLCHRDLSSA